MPRRRPAVASLDEVQITREGDDAVIEYKDPDIPTTYFHIGPSLCGMTDQQILDQFNDVLRADAEVAAAYHHVAIEVPDGCPQIRYFEPGDQWVPRGGVLRCVIDDAGQAAKRSYVDEQCVARRVRTDDLYLRRLGLRITFVPGRDR
jgi:hypothetical protein